MQTLNVERKTKKTPPGGFPWTGRWSVYRIYQGENVGIDIITTLTRYKSNALKGSEMKRELIVQ